MDLVSPQTSGSKKGSEPPKAVKARTKIIILNQYVN